MESTYEHLILVFANNSQEIIFVMSNTGNNATMIGELIKISNFCEIKGLNFTYFTWEDDPSLVIRSKDAIMYDYVSFNDTLSKLNMKLTSAEYKELHKMNGQIYYTISTKNKSDILYLAHQDNTLAKFLKKLLV